MSEAQKPVEETPVAPPAAETAAPTTEAQPPAAEAPKDAPAEPEEPAKEEQKAEVTPATDGVLGHKAPGLVKSLRFSKRYFWFSDDAVEVSKLSTYFQNEKLSIAHPTAAWASQTGKGLLFIAKRAEDKAHPTGMINLAEVSDIAKEGSNELTFKWNGHKHAFQATSGDERDSWFATIEAKSAEGKAEKETIVGSDGYKAELEKLTAKPAAATVAPSSPKKSLEAKGKDATKKPEGEEAKAKSRSQSRKRASIFGNILGKKDEGEAKKEEPKTEDKAEGEDAKKPEAETPAEEPAAAAATTEAETPAETTEAAPATEAKQEEPKRPEAKAKRSSVFGSFLQKVTNQGHGKADKEPAAKPAETTTTVSSTAPQLGDPVNPDASEPIQPESVTQPEANEPAKETQEEPATSPSSIKGGFLNFIKKDKHEEKKEAKPEDKSDKKPEDAPAAEEPAAPEQATGATLKEKRRTSFFGNFGTKKEKKVEAAEGEQAEGEQAKARSPSIPRLGGLFRKPSKAVKKDKEVAPAPAEGEAPAENTEITEIKETTETATPAVNGAETSENKPAEPAAPAAQPVQAAA
ncbi:hypothetical protein CPC735_033900 [Coccidioides posadasii C735 delta SOWgp]|uniref:PH domain-containing protein n=1 Tax=Coccidioides posadasii (strain C735) TaxID=222929 RepID=C5P5R4_COCP7|nr:hypothetical protein CPC735_033900 [Coccidioides posadasii C735 delta SOWgp]EER28054.1 hypothetical protein CPC735_033900 [Coccidioides posadasii C735 delta SOWgp]|eukprot:XP_003070199.1 hypothetical protein CPC735_033900 [Coccidioides posadasii C735 delta SOWgp]